MIKNKNSIKGQSRQGDVLVEQINKLPKVEKHNGEVILAYGEVTGHAHRIRDNAEMFFTEIGDKYLKINNITALTHEEHDAIPFKTGNWAVIQQRTYTPEEIQNVRD